LRVLNIFSVFFGKGNHHSNRAPFVKHAKQVTRFPGIDITLFERFYLYLLPEKTRNVRKKQNRKEASELE
jgi:hypothetical protein